MKREYNTLLRNLLHNETCKNSKPVATNASVYKKDKKEVASDFWQFCELPYKPVGMSQLYSYYVIFQKPQTGSEHLNLTAVKLWMKANLCLPFGGGGCQK